MQLWETNPFEGITITHGNKCTVWDSAGRHYLDLLSGTWCNVLGYSHPRWVHAVQEQVAGMAHIGAQFVTDEIRQGLSKLAEILPPELNRAVFLNTGSEGVELALKMARAATGADCIGIIERGYYGATTYAMALSEAGRSAGYLPALGNVFRLQVPDCRHCAKECMKPCTGSYLCLEDFEETVANGDRNIAAVIYESVIAGEMLVPPSGYIERLRRITSLHNILLIAEEVTTGVGRTGRWFGFQHENIVPDILVIGKAIGAGLPVAVVVTTEDVEKRCKAVMLRHVQSHQNDPYSGRIAAAVISIMQEENLVELACERGNYLMEGLKELKPGIPGIADIRGRGLMIGIELHKDWANNGTVITKKLFESGFIVGYNPITSTIRLFPPYIISTQEIDSFLTAFKETLSGLVPAE